MTAAFVTANPDAPLEAAAALVSAMGLAGEITYNRLSPIIYEIILEVCFGVISRKLQVADWGHHLLSLYKNNAKETQKKKGATL